MLAISCGYDDGDDLDLRTNPGVKLACGRFPDSGRDLCAQPTVSCLEIRKDLRQVIRLTYALVDLYRASYPRPPGAVTLVIDDTVDVEHGHQQLSLFNAHYDERCFLPIHVYDTAALLRPRTTPSGVEVRKHLRRLVRRIRQHWPHTQLTIRGDGHYGRPEVMAFYEANEVDYIFGLPGNKVLDRLVEQAADNVRVRRAEEPVVALRRYSRGAIRRQVLKLPSPQGRPHRFVDQGPRYPLRRHQYRRWQRRVFIDETAVSTRMARLRGRAMPG